MKLHVLILRPGASLLYFNMNYVRDTIEERVRAEKETKLVVLDLSEVSIVDMHAAEMLAGLAGELAAKGIKVQAVEAHSQVRDRLRSEGLAERFGGIERLRTVADVADDFLRGGLGQQDVDVALGDLGDAHPLALDDQVGTATPMPGDLLRKLARLPASPVRTASFPSATPALEVLLSEDTIGAAAIKLTQVRR
jgi:anti-anti-sigma regulatory factor